MPALVCLPEHTPDQRNFEQPLEEHNHGDCLQPVTQVRLIHDEDFPDQDSERRVQDQ